MKSYMTAGSYNFTIEQNSGFTRVLTYKDSTGSPIPLTGYSASLKIRSVGDDGDLVIALTTTPDASGNVITLGGAAGTITILIKGAATALMDFSEARYTLRLTNTSSEPDRLLQGSVSFSRETP